MDRTVKALGHFAGRHPLWVLWVVALALRTLFVVIARPDPLAMIDSLEYHTLASDLLRGEGIKPHLQGYMRPPLYPVFVALCYALGGVLVLQVVQLIMGATTATLIGWLARGLGADRRGTIAAAAVWAVYPWSFQWVGGLATETLFTFLAVIAFIVVLTASRSKGRWRALGAGAVFGAAALTRANLLTLAPPLALWWLWRNRSLAQPALFGAGIFLSLLPYATYSYFSGNGLVLSSNGGGLSFYIGNNPDMTTLYSGTLSDDEWRELNRINLGPAGQAFLGCVPPSRSCGRDVPLAERERWYYANAIRYITRYPGEWARTELLKLVHYWRPWVEPRTYPPAVVAVSGISFGIILLLAILGLRRAPTDPRWFVVTIAIAATISAVLWAVQLRYRFALLDPVLIATGGAPLADLVRHVASWRRRQAVPPISLFASDRT